MGAHHGNRAHGISIYAGRRWKNMTDEEKASYKSAPVVEEPVVEEPAVEEEAAAPKKTARRAAAGRKSRKASA